MAKVVKGQAIIVNGLPELQKAFERIGGGKANFGIEYELQHRLRNIGEHVAVAAEGFITHKTGRHGDPTLPRLEDTLGTSVTAKRATVFSTSPYARVQQFGGGPKAGWTRRGPHVQARNASRFLTKAVASEHAYVEQETDAVLDWIVKEWNA
jgi:phage gpG-like protein